jgi:alkanesulfonate monooxygenase SsuD/methylene tetrahydromethanopterin reductase-like flavin-dependent oxidoreductase (luciferase family)
VLSVFCYAILNEEGDQAANYRGALGLFESAEKLGVEGVWVRQFHLRPGLPSPLVFLSWLAARTTRLRLGTGVVTLPLENPVRVAEDAAVLDALSDGRLELGVANGGGAPGLADVFRGTPATKADYLDGLSRLIEVLDGEPLNGGRLNPPAPGLSARIWEATLTEQSGYQTGARGHGVLIGTTQTVPAEVTARAYYRGLEQHGPAAPRVGLATLIYPAKDRETALREARDGIEEKYAWGKDFLPSASTLAEKAAAINLHYGTAEQITESILAQSALPYATQLMVQTELFYTSYAHRADALELFVREVAPALG